MNELIEAGKVVPIIDKSYPLSEAAEAIRYLETGRAKGKDLITIGQVDTMTQSVEKHITLHYR